MAEQLDRMEYYLKPPCDSEPDSSPLLCAWSSLKFNLLCSSTSPSFLSLTFFRRSPLHHLFPQSLRKPSGGKIVQRLDLRVVSLGQVPWFFGERSTWASIGPLLLRLATEKSEILGVSTADSCGRPCSNWSCCGKVAEILPAAKFLAALGETSCCPLSSDCRLSASGLRETSAAVVTFTWTGLDGVSVTVLYWFRCWDGPFRLRHLNALFSAGRYEPPLIPIFESRKAATDPSALELASVWLLMQIFTAVVSCGYI